jgi:hypothetical protein
VKPFFRVFSIENERVRIEKKRRKREKQRLRS